MSKAARIESLRRRRDGHLRSIQLIAEGMDEYEQSVNPNVNSLSTFEKALGDEWGRLQLVYGDLIELDDEECKHEDTSYKSYMALNTRLTTLMQSEQSVKPSKPTGGEFPATTVHLPEIRLPTFDGAIENWHSFYDFFSSTIGRDERLTPVQKLHYLRSSLTGRAARSIQTLEMTNINYSIALDVLKDKFDCHRQVCMRHWQLIDEYPRITKETPEAIDDFLETVKVNLKALEKLGEPVTSNVVLITLFTSKLPSATIRKWQRTLPDKKMPSYLHLVDFLKTRANGDRTGPTPTATRRWPVQPKTAREPKPRGNAFAVTRSPSTCPICRGNHEIRSCDVFKARSAKGRLEMAKKASICTNCLGKGHSLSQCSAGSCRICNQRHHTYLHRDQAHVKTRSSRGQSSIGRSSSGRSSNGRSLSGSPIPRSSRHTRHSPTPH
jgi:hypothetical protein